MTLYDHFYHMSWEMYYSINHEVLADMDQGTYNNAILHLI